MRPPVRPGHRPANGARADQRFPDQRVRSPRVDARPSDDERDGSVRPVRRQRDRLRRARRIAVRDARAEGAYLNGSYAGEPLPDEPRVNGSPGVHGPFDDEPPVGRPALPDEWTREHRGSGPPLRVRHRQRPRTRLATRRTDPITGPTSVPTSGPVPPGGPAGRIEATVWASMALGAARPSTVAPDGSDDWTLPLPVVRPAPEPELRTSARHSAGSPHGAGALAAKPKNGPPSSGPPSSGQPSSGPPEPWTTDRSVVGPAPGAGPGDYRGALLGPAPARRWPPRAGAGPGDRSTRASRRNAGSHARHAEESDDARRRADQARHRRPDH